MFTDIVGFTEATASRSRSESAKLLSDHNQTLIPLIKRFRGELIKSIGDALLVVFASPTDALLCAMAMQDSLHAYNSNILQDNQIHIRIAVNVGEVRVVDGDVLGDPVNVASRIESITPSDQIYFSEAVYMTMNKAEVSAKEVGLTNFKGMAEQLRLFTIPPFCSAKLVPNYEVPQGADRYPFGGWHLREIYKEEKRWGVPLLGLALAASIVLLCLGFVRFSKVQPEVVKVEEQVPIKAASPSEAEREDLHRRIPHTLPETAKHLMKEFVKKPPQERFPRFGELKKQENIRVVEEKYRRTHKKFK